MLESHWHLSVVAIDISKHLVSFTLVFLVVVFNAKLKEFLKVLNSTLVVVAIHLLLY